MSEDSMWWGNYPAEIDEPRLWVVGPLHLRIERLNQELRVTHWRDGGAYERELVVDGPVENDPPLQAELQRFGFEQSPDMVNVAPALADRPIVNRPEFPFHLPPRESTTIYVSSPLWIQIRTRPDGPVLFEVPIHEPSDTWFGPNTRVGELCYANRTAARVNLGNLVHLPQRIVSAVAIQNRSDQRLDLERFKLPAPVLSVHAAADSNLWTEKITLVRESVSDAAELKLEHKPPAEAGDTEFLREPRQKPTGALLRAFGRIVGRGAGDDR